MGDMNKISGFVRGHLGAAIAAVAMAVVVVGGVLILILVGSGGASPASATTSPTTVATLAPPRAGAGAGSSTGQHRQGVRGEITAINGDTWTVMSEKGVPVTVDVTSTTTFGTKAKPLTASDFAVGDSVVVLGSRTGTTVTPTRIALAPLKAPAAPTTTLPAAAS